jgi:hypothetical protein
MNRIFTVIAMTGMMMLVGTRALAADSVNPPTMSKRQLIAQVVGCMKRQMSASNSISYNAAMKACKDQIGRQSDSATSRTLVASDGLTKP